MWPSVAIHSFSNQKDIGLPTFSHGRTQTKKTLNCRKELDLLTICFIIIVQWFFPRGRNKGHLLYLSMWQLVLISFNVKYPIYFLIATFFPFTCWYPTRWISLQRELLAVHFFKFGSTYTRTYSKLSYVKFVVDIQDINVWLVRSKGWYNSTKIFPSFFLIYLYFI